MEQVVAPKRSFNYEAFIEELIPLIEEAEALLVSRPHMETEGFRTWRFHLSDLLARVRRLKYSVRCDMETRVFFRVLNDRNKNQAQFIDAMKDTLIELRLLVTNFQKYGDPKAKDAAPVEQIEQLRAGGMQIVEVVEEVPSPARLEVPEKITIPWLLKNVHFTQLGGAIILIFSAGFAFASWTPIAAWVARAMK